MVVNDSSQVVQETVGYIQMPLQESARTEALATHGTQIPWVFIMIICLPLVPIIVLVLCEFLTAKFALKFMAVRRLVNILLSLGSCFVTYVCF